MFPDTKKALAEMNRVLKEGGKLAVMMFVNRRFFRFRRIREHAREKHGAHVFDVEELSSTLSKTGFKDFTYDVYGSMILFRAVRKLARGIA